MPSASGSLPDGISTPNSAVMSIFSEPCGYLVGTFSTKMSPAGGNARRRTSAASGLLSSTPMMARFAPVARMAWRMPTIRSPACSTMRRWSQVRYGSHSQPLTTSVSTLAPAGSASLAWLGKAAPPCPTMPVRCTASRISWGGKASMSCGAPHSTSWVEAS